MSCGHGSARVLVLMAHRPKEQSFRISRDIALPFVQAAPMIPWYPTAAFVATVHVSAVRRSRMEIGQGQTPVSLVESLLNSWHTVRSHCHCSRCGVNRLRVRTCLLGSKQCSSQNSAKILCKKQWCVILCPADDPSCGMTILICRCGWRCIAAGAASWCLPRFVQPFSTL